MLPYSIAVQLQQRGKLRLVQWAVQYRGGVVARGLTLEEAEARAKERNEGALKLPPAADAEARCTCGQQKWKCATQDFAAHLRRTGA